MKMKDLTPYLHPEYKESLGLVPEEKQETLALNDVIAKLKAEAVWPHIEE